MGVAPRWAVAGARELSALLESSAARTGELVTVVVQKSAADLVAATQRRASGRPGPNVITGDYRGSWSVELVEHSPVAVSYSAGTNRPQAPRLEYGFVGTDSLGRHYDQPPYPHMGPAADEIAPAFYAAMGKVADMAVRW